MPDLLAEASPALSEATAKLRRAGIPGPRREAFRLWTLVADLPPEYQPADGGVTAHFVEAVDRRAAGLPLQYAAQVAGFRHLVLRSDRRALIPRPETEGLIEVALALVDRGRALDLGTGSGCLALALAGEGGFEEVVAVDRSEAALALARENGVRTGLSVRWMAGDWTGPVAGERFDLVVSNPPYLATHELALLDPGVRAWEPHLALDGGPDGLRPTERLLHEVPGILAPRGILALEIDSRRGAATAALAARLGWLDVGILPDLFGRDRYLTARRECSP